MQAVVTAMVAREILLRNGYVAAAAGWRHPFRLRRLA